jgi:hypothetical protein
MAKPLVKSWSPIVLSWRRRFCELELRDRVCAFGFLSEERGRYLNRDMRVFDHAHDRLGKAESVGQSAYRLNALLRVPRAGIERREAELYCCVADRSKSFADGRVTFSIARRAEPGGEAADDRHHASSGSASMGSPLIWRHSSSLMRFRSTLPRIGAGA